MKLFIEFFVIILIGVSSELLGFPMFASVGNFLIVAATALIWGFSWIYIAKKFNIK